MKGSQEDVTIFVVDDDDIDAMGIERALLKLKLHNTLIRAVDGIDALEYLRGENGKNKIVRPFIMLLDLNMPRMNGLELLEAMRGDPELSESVVIVLTTSASEKDMTEAYGNNVAGYIVKSELENSFLGVLELINFYCKIVRLPGS